MSDPGVRRRVLVVGREYFFYTREIVAGMREMFGAQVTFLPITPRGGIFRILGKLSTATARRWLTRYHRAALERLRGEQFDAVLFIQVHQVGELVREYRAAFPGALFTLYYWDSLRTHDYLPFVGYFERVFSFDREDVVRHQELRYLPLFFCDRFTRLRSASQQPWDVAFVGIASNMRRYQQLSAFDDWARRSGLRFDKHLVVSPIFYLRALLRGRWLRKVRFRSLSADEVVGVYGSAKAIVDLPNNFQSGLTMRTFEALGAHRKLITTNQAILQEDFYTPESVCVIGNGHGDFPDIPFLKASPVFSSAIERYSLRAWISALMGWTTTRSET